MIRTVIGDILAAALFLAVLSFGLALAASPVHSIIKGWHQRSDLENTFRILAGALGLIIGISIIAHALSTGIDFSSLTR